MIDVIDLHAYVRCERCRQGLNQDSTLRFAKICDYYWKWYFVVKVLFLIGLLLRQAFVLGKECFAPAPLLSMVLLCGL